MGQVARACAAGEAEQRYQFAAQGAELVRLVGHGDDRRVGRDKTPVAQAEPAGSACGTGQGGQPLRAVPLPELVLGPVELLVHRQQPDKVGVHRLLRDAQGGRF
jgi:hypothetical protein